MPEPAGEAGLHRPRQHGCAMATRLVAWPGGVTVFDVRTGAMAPLVDAGATPRAASRRWPTRTSSASPCSMMRRCAT